MNQEISPRFTIFPTSVYLSTILLAFLANSTQGGPTAEKLNEISLDHTFDRLESILDGKTFYSLEYRSTFQHTNYGSFNLCNPASLWNPTDLQEKFHSEIKDMEPDVSSLKKSRMGTIEDLLEELNQGDTVAPVDDGSSKDLYQKYISILEPESSTRKRKVGPEFYSEKEFQSQLSLYEAGLNSGSSYTQENTKEPGMIHSTFLDYVHGNKMEDQRKLRSRQEAANILLNKMTSHKILKFKHPLQKYILSTMSKNYEDLKLRGKNAGNKMNDSDCFANIPISRWNNISRPLGKSSRQYIRKEAFIPRMETLINWVLLIHKSTQMEISPNVSEEEDMESSKVIVDWINHETFFTHLSVPVLGVIQKKNYSMNESAFEEVQLIIIRYLSDTHSSELCLSTALALLTILTRKPSHHNQSTAIHLFNDERTSKLFIENTIAHYLEVVRKYKEQLRSTLPEKIQSFQKEIPPKIIPKKFVDIHDQKLDPDCKELLEEIEKLYGLEKPEHQNYHSKTLPVYIVYDEESPPFKSIKISCRDNRRIPLKIMISRAKSLLVYLIICHNVIIEELFLGIEIFNKDGVQESKANLMKVVYKELFSPEKGLPIFGEIDTEENQLDRSKFGDIQTLCIYYFSIPRSYKMLPSIFIEFLELWIKQFHPEQWDNLFQHNIKFSTHITDLLVCNQKKISEACEESSVRNMNKRKKIEN